MDRRAFLKTSATATALSAASFARGALANVAEAGRWRAFEVTYRLEVQKPAGVTRTWLPLPLSEDTGYFKNLGSSWSAGGGRASATIDPKYGAGIAMAEFPEGVANPTFLVVSRFATRDRSVDFAKPGNARPEDPKVLQRSLQGTDLIPVDGIVRETAMDITKGLRSDMDKARALYEWVVENTFRDPKTRGCGWGDIKAMLETRNFGGKCGDINAMFVGLARASGIPARDIYGIRVAKSELGYKSLGVGTEVISKAQHCRADFYLPEYGWIPVDPGDVRKVVLEEAPGLTLASDVAKANRARLFGAWEMNWLAYNYAHDVVLPGARFGKIPYLMYPNGETAAERLDSLEPDPFKYTITARELKVA
ncbi:MAG: transglutaminase domain-containing protein [Betaproteobacteria bacterium]|nr:transglutaminase domain-containing protein [Betaproteobacteria bacterium]